MKPGEAKIGDKGSIMEEGIWKRRALGSGFLGLREEGWDVESRLSGKRG